MVKSEADVKKKLKTYKIDSIKNDFNGVKKITVEDYMNNWFYTVQKNELKPKSFDRQEATLKYQVYKYIGDIQIGSLGSLSSLSAGRFCTLPLRHFPSTVSTG